MRIGFWRTGLLTASGLKALILPAITLGLFQMTLVTRLVRSEMLEVLRTDYIKFARARGLPERAINFGHALRNTLVPVITVIGLQLGAIIAFAIITETVFQWPGMGLMFIQAVQNADIPVMAAYLLLVAFLFVLINFIVDLIYVRIDPRIRIFGRACERHANDVPGDRIRNPSARRRRCASARWRREPAHVRSQPARRIPRQRPVHSFLRSKLVVAAALLTRC